MLGNMGAKIGASLATTAIQSKMAQNSGSNGVRHVKKRPNKPKRRNNRRKRDLEAEDELDLAAREDMDEFVERELDVFERDMDEDLYLD